MYIMPKLSSSHVNLILSELNLDIIDISFKYI